MTQLKSQVKNSDLNRVSQSPFKVK